MHAENVSLAREAVGANTAYSENPASASVPKGPAAEGIIAAKRGGRKPVVTPARKTFICELLAKGSTEKAACLRAGIGETAWTDAKKRDADLRAMIAAARDRWADLRHRQYMAARLESQCHRSATRKALPVTPTKSARFVMWRLIRLPLNIVVIPENEIEAACQPSGIVVDQWHRQDAAFGLMRQVYAKRAKIRGERPPVRSFTPVVVTGWQPEYVEDEYSRFRP